MWLKKVETGHLIPRIMMGAYTLVQRVRVPDVVRTLIYRPRLCGRAYNRWLHTIMRGGSGWAVGERELFAAFTSHRNQCPF